MNNKNSKNLVKSNLPEKFTQMTGKYSKQMSFNTVFNRFLLSKNEMPKEITVQKPILLEDYPESQKNQIYVSVKSGDDSNSGTEKNPLKTLNKAAELMKGKKGGVVFVEGGTYVLDNSVKFDLENCGSPEAPLFVKAYGDEKPVFTSNKLVDSKSFVPVDPINDKVAARLPKKVQDKVFVTNLYENGWQKEDIVEITKKGGPARLYADGEECTLARFPNAFDEDGKPTHITKLLYFKHVYDTGSVVAREGSNLYWPWVERANADPNLTPDSILGWELRVINDHDNGQGFEYQDPKDGWMGDEILSWVNTGDIWYYGSTFEGWEFAYYTLDKDCVHDGNLLGMKKDDGYYSIKSVQPNVYGAKVSGNSPAGRNTFFLFNAIEALDAPGEWFIDKESGNLYIYPKRKDVTNMLVTYSGNSDFPLISAENAQYIVFDGICVNGSNNAGILVERSENIVIQNATLTNTKLPNAVFKDSYRGALISSDLSYAYGAMVSVSNDEALYKLKPSEIYIQNNFLHNAAPTHPYSVSLSGCRAVVSHNYFYEASLAGSGAEHIVEYNVFRGGSRDVTDGGMTYFFGLNQKGHHIRYNLYHMFNASHNAVYCDGMGGGMYAYGNVISTLGSKSNFNKGWYSSTGHGNVCYQNIMILRNAKQIAESKGLETDEGTDMIKKGDDINESALFYYYYGNNAKGNSLAGHWWVGNKTKEIELRTERCDVKEWEKRNPDYMEFLEGTKLILEAYKNAEGYKVVYEPEKRTGKTFTYPAKDGTTFYIPYYVFSDEWEGVMYQYPVQAHTVVAKNGKGVTLKYEEIAAMERLRRQPAYSIIKDNVILGGSADPSMVITNGALMYKGYIQNLTGIENNYLNYDYNEIIEDAENHNYKVKDGAWNTIESVIGKEAVDELKTIDYTKFGTL
ncbi:MAG: DUF1565 domain-containing protein [Ruminococcaceae bacterium]|nr:DUF1565 domain-containing protein [Oscillospiraceae bacterium]